MVRGAASRCPLAPGGLVTAAIALAVLSSAAASTASAQSGAPYYPAGYVAPTTTTYTAPVMPAYGERTTSIRGLWIPGLIGLPIAWVATWVHASLSLTAGSEGENVAFIPAVGPWLVLASQNADAGYYIAAGIVQDVSLLCLVLGLAIRIPEARARVALGDATLELATTGSAMSATIQF